MESGSHESTFRTDSGRFRWFAGRTYRSYRYLGRCRRYRTRHPGGRQSAYDLPRPAHIRGNGNIHQCRWEGHLRRHIHAAEVQRREWRPEGDRGAEGTLTDANGTSLGTVNQTVTNSVNTSNAAAAPAACNVLNLFLGPLNLNLLGLVVTLNQVHLTITAVPGAGNLLGNLLCAVANLLNGTGSLSTLSALLNQILAAFGL